MPSFAHRNRYNIAHNYKLRHSYVSELDGGSMAVDNGLIIKIR